MRKYIPIAQMSQAQREKYQAKRQRMNAKPQRQSQEQARNYLRHGKQWTLDPERTVVCAIDGEASNDGHYWLFQAYTDELGMRTLKTAVDKRLGVVEIHRFLLAVKREIRRKCNKSVVFVAYSFGYDKSQMLFGERHLTYTQAREVWKQQSKTRGAVVGPEYKEEIDIPGTNASIYMGRKTGYMVFHHGDKRDQRVAWQDMWSLFGCSFVKAVGGYAKYWTPEEHASYDSDLVAVTEGKAARGDWLEQGYTDKDVAERYQLPELRLMVWLAKFVVRLCKELELYPRTIAGPAPMARALLHKYGVTAHVKPSDYDTIEYQISRFNRVACHAYYGGNIQLAVTGHLASYHKYDLTSAYPSRAKHLPCLAHGERRQLGADEIVAANRGELQDGAIYHIYWQCPRDTPWPPLPHRQRTGAIHNPLEGQGDYHAVELAALFRNFDHRTKIEIDQGYIWESTCDCVHPFDSMVQATFDERAKYKKEKHPAGDILKLALNSLYGVLAQTAGQRRVVDENGETVGYKTPKHSNIIGAGMITAGCRAAIMDAIALAPENVIGVMTDAIITLESHPLVAIEADDKITDRILGGWEHEWIQENTYAIAPGIMFGESGHDKIRGIPNASQWCIGEKQFDTAYLARKWASDHDITYIEAEFLQYQNPYQPGTGAENWGKFIPARRIIDISPEILRNKRDVKRKFLLAPDLWYLPPHLRSSQLESAPYLRPMDKGYTPREDVERYDP